MSNLPVSWDDVSDSFEKNRLAVADGANFIEIYDEALDKVSCNRLIELFERYDTKGLCQQGASSTHVDKTLKDSSDLIIGREFMTDPDNAEFHAALTPVVKCLQEYCVKYLSKYHCLLPMAMQGQNGSGEYILHDEIMKNPQLAMQAMQSKFTIERLQLQRYKPPGQGFHAWHFEQSSAQTMNRVLFPVLYLNDVDQGGETEFYYWDVAVKPKAGTLLLAPGEFTHTHRMRPGVLSNSKYILTTWYVRHT